MEDLQPVFERAEERAREYLFSRVPKRKVREFGVSIDAVEEKGGFSIDVEVSLQLSPSLRSVNVEELVDELVEKVFKVIDEEFSKQKGEVAGGGAEKA